MTLGYDKPLYLLAFDHRGSFEQDLFGASEPVSAQVRQGIISVKHIVFDAHARALAEGAPRDACGILVDEEFGTGVARRAKAERIPLAMPVEKSGQQEFEFQYSDDFDGFAVGLTLWEQALTRYLAGQASHDEAVFEISSRYRDVIDAYRRAEPALDCGRE
ncbi:MAG: hypothetical protein ACRDOK_00970 [Streptosporangiaceae bacterium]